MCLRLRYSILLPLSLLQNSGAPRHHFCTVAEKGAQRIQDTKIYIYTDISLRRFLHPPSHFNAVCPREIFLLVPALVSSVTTVSPPPFFSLPFSFLFLFKRRYICRGVLIIKIGEGR